MFWEGYQDKGDGVRAAPQPVLEVTMQTGVAVVGITHTGKSAERSRTADRLLGSVQFVNMARIVHVVVSDEFNAELKLVVCVRANNSDKGVFAFFAVRRTARDAKLGDEGFEPPTSAV